MTKAIEIFGTVERLTEVKDYWATLGIKASFFYGQGGVTGLKLSASEIERLVVLLAK